MIHGRSLTSKPSNGSFEALFHFLHLTAEREEQAERLLRRVLDKAQGKPTRRGKARRVGRHIKYRGKRAHRLFVEMGACVAVYGSSRINTPGLPM
jgi:hypothetical protein